MSEEWGPWIDHDGRGCPCVGMLVEGVFLNAMALRDDPSFIVGVQEDREIFIAGSDGGGSWDWSNWPHYSKIIRYRIRKPKGLTILEGLLENLPKEMEVTP